MFLRRSRRLALNLDSLTDIVTCSVGIAVFVVLHGVLSTGGLVVNKRLPILQEDDTKTMVRVLCEANTVRPFDLDRLIDQMLAEAPPPDTFGQVRGSVDRWNGRVKADGFMRVTGYAGYFEESWGLYSERKLDWGVYIEPLRSGGHDTVLTVGQPDGCYQRLLARLKPDREFISFLVDPQSVEVFEKCADLARGKGIEVGWQPLVGGWPVRISMMGDTQPEGPGGWWQRQ